MIGIDVGGTRIKLGAVEGARVVRKVAIETPRHASPDTFFDALATAVRAFDPSPAEIGMAIPGEVDAQGKCVRLPNIPGFEGVAMAAELERRTGARVAVENDGTAAVHAESLFGHGKEYPSLLIVTLGTGIGGGLVIDRRLVRGSHGFGGEIGHVTVDSAPDARECACGNRGCLEAYAGTRGILARYFESGGLPTTSIREVAGSARRGERPGVLAFESMTRALAIALNSIQNVLDLDAIVFTGGVSRSVDLIVPGIRAELEKRAFAKVLGEVPLLESELGEDAGVVGAAHLPRLLDG
jgi:glucokinase